MRPAGLLLAGLACLASRAHAAPPQQVTIVAHRGLAEGMPENTIAAFLQSVERGLGIIESTFGRRGMVISSSSMT